MPVTAQAPTPVTPEDPNDPVVLRARLDRVTAAYNDAWNYYQACDHFTQFERGAIEALGKIHTALTA